MLGTIGCAFAQDAAVLTMRPARMPKTGTVDSRFVSYNIEMVEVTGGRFWKPYSTDGQIDVGGPAHDANGRLNPNLFEYRPAIDLSNARLRKLAKGLGPAYIRVSGAWATTTYFQDDDGPLLKVPPAGFEHVLSRAQWKAVIGFAHSVRAEIVTSFAISPGTRGPDGIWTSTQAKAILNYTKAQGGHIAAAEFVNEPNVAARQGAPAEYDAAAFAKDMKVFLPFLRSESPDTLLVGPGATGRNTGSEEILKATGPIFDVFSYHFYGATSRRCTSVGLGKGLTFERALSPEWLDSTNQAEDFYAAQRDHFLQGKPIWLTETAEAACGGDPFAAQFVDTFRFVNQLGTLARKGVNVVMHNTFAASDYGLLDDKNLEPRPDYWAAVLWNRTMGTTVLDPGVSTDGPVRVYAHCEKTVLGGVTVLALNTGSSAHKLNLPLAGEQLQLTAPSLSSTTVYLNGRELKAGPDGSLPAMKGKRFKAGNLRLPPQSISFLTMSLARNPVCK